MPPMSRRGQLVGESLTLFVVTMVVLGLMLVFFFMIKSINTGVADTEQMKSFALEDSAWSSLKAYANTPVSIEYGGENVTVSMAELIRLAKINDSYKGILEDESTKIFTEIYGNNNYRLDVKDVFSIDRLESISNPSQPDITIQKSQTSFTDEASSTLKLSDIEITIYLKIK